MRLTKYIEGWRHIFRHQFNTERKLEKLKHYRRTLVSRFLNQRGLREQASTPLQYGKKIREIRTKPEYLNECITLLVLIDFCPVQGESLTWCSITKNFDILSEMIIEYQI